MKDPCGHLCDTAHTCAAAQDASFVLTAKHLPPLTHPKSSGHIICRGSCRRSGTHDEEALELAGHRQQSMTNLEDSDDDESGEEDSEGEEGDDIPDSDDEGEEGEEDGEEDDGEEDDEDEDGEDAEEDAELAMAIFQSMDEARRRARDYI